MCSLSRGWSDSDKDKPSIYLTQNALKTSQAPPKAVTTKSLSSDWRKGIIAPSLYFWQRTVVKTHWQHEWTCRQLELKTGWSFGTGKNMLVWSHTERVNYSGRCLETLIDGHATSLIPLTRVAWRAPQECYKLLWFLDEMRNAYVLCQNFTFICL